MARKTTRKPTTTATRMPVKGDRILYHDPDSTEAVPAIVCKILDGLGGTHPRINLVYFTERGAVGSQTDVPWGPGKMDHWWFPDQAE